MLWHCQKHRCRRALQRGTGVLGSGAAAAEPVVLQKRRSVSPSDMGADVEPHAFHCDPAQRRQLLHAEAPMGPHFAGLVGCEQGVVPRQQEQHDLRSDEHHGLPHAQGSRARRPLLHLPQYGELAAPYAASLVVGGLLASRPSPDLYRALTLVSRWVKMHIDAFSAHVRINRMPDVDARRS